MNWARSIEMFLLHSFYLFARSCSKISFLGFDTFLMGKLSQGIADSLSRFQLSPCVVHEVIKLMVIILKVIDSSVSLLQFVMFCLSFSQFSLA